MAKNVQESKTPSLGSYRVLDLAILIFALIFVVDALLYLVIGGSIRDFVINIKAEGIDSNSGDTKREPSLLR